MFLTRGRARLIAAACQQHVFLSSELQPPNLTAWRALRQELTQRQATRALQRRFRHDPVAYLADAERLLHPETLPAYFFAQVAVGPTSGTVCARSAAGGFEADVGFSAALLELGSARLTRGTVSGWRDAEV